MHFYVAFVFADIYQKYKDVIPNIFYADKESLRDTINTISVKINIPASCDIILWQKPI